MDSQQPKKSLRKLSQISSKKLTSHSTNQSGKEDSSESPTTSQTDTYTLPFSEWLNDSHAFVAASKPTVSLYENEYLLSISNGDSIIDFYFNISDTETRTEALNALLILKNGISSLEQSILEFKLPEGG